MVLNNFASSTSTFHITDPIKGQQALALYDPLKQMVYRPELRAGAGGKPAIVLPYAETSLWGLMSQLQALFGADKKTVNAREFYWAEYDSWETLAFTVNRFTGAVPAGGTAVTVNINALSNSKNGVFSKPIPGFYAFIKELDNQEVKITGVNKTLQTVTLEPINGEVLNLTQYGLYTIIMVPMKTYDLADTADIATHGMVKNPPILYKSFVQKYEDGFAVDESEIDNYVYERDWWIAKGMDATGKPIDYFYIPTLTRQAEAMITDNRNLRTLLSHRDNINGLNFDGIIPTAKKYGMFNFAYDVFLQDSFKGLLFAMIKTLRKVNGSNEYIMAHDFNFNIDWSDAIAALTKNAGQSLRYSLFGDGGEGTRDFKYYQFKDFEAFGYKFRSYMMDAFDARRYGHALEYFALLMPAKTFIDTDGNRVPIVTYVNIKGAEMAKEQRVWIDDARERGGRNLRCFIKDAWGMEIHAPTRLGMIWKGNVGS
jgi:hypothetical protein